MPSKTHTEKLLHVTFGIHKKQISLADIARSLVAPTSSRQSFPLPLEPIKNSSFVRHPQCEAGSKPLAQVPWRRRSDKMLSPCQAKPGPTKCFPLPLEPINTSAFVRHRSCGRSSETIGASPLEAGSETPEQQQDSSPCQAKRIPKNCFTSPLESIKNKSLWPIQPDHSSLRHHLGKWPCMGTRPSLWRKSFGGRFRNTRTAAGFEPMPSKTQPDKMLPVTLGIHKKQFFCPAPSEAGSETPEQ